MKNILLLVFILFYSSLSFSQQIKAITDEGRSVILNSDFTWKYDEDSEDFIIPKEITMNRDTMRKSPKSTFQLKSKKTNYSYWFNPTKWGISDKPTNNNAEYMLYFKTAEIFTLMIAEEIQIPIESLKEIAIEQFKNYASDVKIINEEYRIVNGLKVLHLEVNATVRGIKVTYFGYYHSNEFGTIQYVTFSSQNIMNKHKTDCLILLNGLIKRELAK
jgi:hypothetical protein